jgi:hypothetical protein
MTTINQLPLLPTLASGDQLVVWATGQGDSRRVSVATFTEHVLASPSITGTMRISGHVVTQGAADSGGAGFRVLRVPN